MQSQEAAAKNKRNSESDVSAKVLAMYAGNRTPPIEPQWLAAGLSQDEATGKKGIIRKKEGKDII